jgi:MFS family permease
VGPMAVAALVAADGTDAFRTAFGAALAILIAFQLAFMHLFRNPQLSQPVAPSRSDVRLADILRVLMRDRTMLLLTLSGGIFLAGYVQIESTVAQMLQKEHERGLWLYSILQTLNCVLVIATQLPLQLFASRQSMRFVLVAGSAIAAAGMALFALPPSSAGAVLAMTLITLGEVLVFPNNAIMTERLAPAHLKGSYFGASNLRLLGFVAGPPLGGFLYQTFGRDVTFATMTVLMLLSGVVVTFAIRRDIDQARLSPPVHDPSQSARRRNQ